MEMKFTKEEKSDLIERIQTYFYEERDGEIGELGAELLLDFFVTQIGPAFYNKGVQDAKEIAMERMVSLDVDLEALKRTKR
jgi:uncharacterized protein (DUF2164 family)